jgi:hypothetical protein
VFWGAKKKKTKIARQRSHVYLYFISWMYVFEGIEIDLFYIYDVFNQTIYVYFVCVISIPKYYLNMISDNDRKIIFCDYINRLFVFVSETVCVWMHF